MPDSFHEGPKKHVTMKTKKHVTMKTISFFCLTDIGEYTAQWRESGGGNGTLRNFLQYDQDQSKLLFNRKFMKEAENFVANLLRSLLVDVTVPI